MDMRYHSLSKPIELTFANAPSAIPSFGNDAFHLAPTGYDNNTGAARERSGTVDSQQPVDWRTVSAMFEQKK
jgi:hypothetical protein